jgi:hypothetical protein
VSKSKFPKITIQNKNPGKPLTGASTMLMIDGRPLRGVTAFNLKITAAGIAKVKLEMISDLDADFEVESLPLNTKKRLSK